MCAHLAGVAEALSADGGIHERFLSVEISQQRHKGRCCSEGGGGEGRLADKGVRGKDVQRWTGMAFSSERDAVVLGTTKCCRGAIGSVARECGGGWWRIERACWRVMRTGCVHTGSFFHFLRGIMPMTHAQRSCLKRRSQVRKRVGGAAKVRS